MATVSNPLYGLENLFSALYTGDPETRKAERASLIAKRNKDAELTDLRIQNERVKQDAANAPPVDPISALAGAIAPDSDPSEVKNYMRGAVVQPQQETSDVPGIIGGYKTPMPATMTPDQDSAIRRNVRDLAIMQLIPKGQNIHQLGQYRGTEQQQGLAEDIIAGKKPADVVAAALTAVQGKTAPYKEGPSGGTINVFGGAQNQTAPVPVARAGEFNARAGKENAQAGQARALAGKITSETLPQIAVPAPDGITTPSGTVPLRGADVSKAITKPVPAATAKGWKMFTDADGANFRVNENAGLVQKKSGAGWEDVDSLPAGTTHIGSNVGVKDNVRTSLVLGGAQNALDRLTEAEKKFGKVDVLRGSPYLGKHPKGVVSEVMHGIGREMISDEQLNKDSYITGIVDEAIPVFTGGLRSSDSFRDFLLSQLPRSVGDNDVTTKQKWDIFKKNVTGQSNAFRNKFNSTPSFRAAGETNRPAAPPGAPAAGAGPTVTNW